MAHFPDLTPCEYFDREGEPSPNLIAVGWLEAPHPYPRGSVSPEFAARLFELIETVWDPILFRGGHGCNLSHPISDVPVTRMRNAGGREVDVGARNLFIPMQESAGIFVAPSLILHYVADHGYVPPAEFQEAVLACPDTDSSAYLRRMGPLIPESERWRDGLYGYWTSMGAAIATEAGLMSRSQFDSCFDIFRAGRSSFSRSDLAPAAPGWFAAQYMEPLAALGDGLENRGQADDARAVRAWLDSVRFVGRMAPASRVELD